MLLERRRQKANPKRLYRLYREEHRALRLLTVLDNYTRECLAIEVDSCLSSQRVTRVLEWVMEQRGAAGDDPV